MREGKDMIEYQEFLCYELSNDGTHQELEMEEEAIEGNLKPDDVLIFVKQDMRRLWIWKGPKAPVRKRFISSRVAAKIQEEIRRESGRHLKIVSVDAGDEPIEFLSTFNLESMEITEKMNDMVYIRNIERDRAKEEQIKKTIRESQAEEEYWSPLLEESQNSGPIKSGLSSQAARPRLPPQKTIQPKESSIEQDLKIIKEIIEKNPPKGMQRVNIIIGRRLYAPLKKTSEVFGETIETETWDVVLNLPKDIINFTTKQIRVYSEKDTGQIKATEVYKKIPSKSKKTTKAKSEGKKEENSEDTPKTNRDLPKIPSSEE
jgi:hypothetical protein